MRTVCFADRESVFTAKHCVPVDSTPGIYSAPRHAFPKISSMGLARYLPVGMMKFYQIFGNDS